MSSQGGSTEWQARSATLIEMPMAEGQPKLGVEQGPRAIIEAGLPAYLHSLGWSVETLHAQEKKNSGDENVNTMQQEGWPKHVHRMPRLKAYGNGDIGSSQLIGERCREYAYKARAAALSRKFVVSLGGDHSIATASISGMLTVYPDLAVIWVDAHGDINTPETSPSKHYHGMPAAHLLGWFSKTAPGFDWMVNVPVLPEQRLAFIGLRDLDALEKQSILASKVTALTMRNVDELGIAATIRHALKAVDPEGTRPLHLSLDIDACDPSIAPGTGTQSRGGLTFREVRFICEEVYRTQRLVSMDLVEVNPQIDVAAPLLHDELFVKATATQTVRLGVELVATAMGRVLL